MENGKKVAIGAGIATATGLSIWGLTKLFKKKPIIPIIYECPYCEEQFPTEAELLAHLAEYHPEKPPAILYTCPYCDAKFATEKELEEHIEADHPEVVAPILAFDVLAILDVEGIPFTSVGEEPVASMANIATKLSQWFRTNLLAAQNSFFPSVEAATNAAEWIIYTGLEGNLGLARNREAVKQAYIRVIEEHPEWFSGYARQWWTTNFFAAMMVTRWASSTETMRTAYLAQPITMSKMRGVTLTCQWKRWVSPSQWITYSTMAHLWYEPTFFAEMSPPGFRSGYTPYPTSEEAAKRPVEIGVAGRFFGGYYYPGIYDGKFQFQGFFDGYDGTPLANFRIENLARVTGKGTVT